MSYRGKLIFAFRAKIYRLDTVSTAAVTFPGGGPPAAGYDDVFKEPVKTPDLDGKAIGVSARQELSPILLKCQFEATRQNTMNMGIGGDNPMTEIHLIFHFKHLEAEGLVDSDGECTLRKGDRIAEIQDKNGNVVRTFADPPGMFIEEINPVSFGIGYGNPKRNILDVIIKSRTQGAL